MHDRYDKKMSKGFCFERMAGSNGVSRLIAAPQHTRFLANMTGNPSSVT
jgi:hypothetical protein